MITSTKLILLSIVTNNIVAKELTRLALLSLLLLLTACSTLTSKPKPVIEFADNSAIQQWQLRGKMGIRNSKQATSAYLNWQQCGNRFDIRLSGPLGQGAAHLYGDSDGVTLAARGEQLPITANKPEQLLYQQLGWNIPVSQLYYWVRGIPDPDQSYRLSSHGFQQSGWQLSYPASDGVEQNNVEQNSVERYTLPTKVVAEHPQLTVTLLLKNWNIQPTCAPAKDTLSQ